MHRRIGVIFQDFVRYQLKVGENIGAGDDLAYDDRARWVEAADRGLAAPIIDNLPDRYDTQLGRWFKNRRELSGTPPIDALADSQQRIRSRLR